MEEYKIKSSIKSSNKVYIVRYFEGTNKWVCNCPSYVFHKIGFECKHIKKAKKLRNKQRG